MTPSHLPRLVLRVGVAGHRLHKLPVAQRDGLRAELRQVLTALASAAASVRREHSWAFADEALETRLISSLAAGADCYAAQAALDAAYVLEVVLPFPEEDYIRDLAVNANTVDTADPEAIAATATFTRLRTQARAVFTLEKIDETDIMARDRAYLAAGRLVLEQSDVLLAVWNGEKTTYLAGTARVVEEALERNSLVVLFDPTGEHPPRLHSHSLPGMRADWNAMPEALRGEEPSDALREQLRQLLAPPADHVEEDERSAADRLRTFHGEACRDTSIWSAYDNLRSLCCSPVRLRFTVPIWPATANFASVKKSFLDKLPSVTGSIRVSLETVLERWLVADNISTALSHVYRSAYVLNFGLAAAAVVIGLACILWNDANIKAFCVSLEVLFITAILIITKQGRSRRWHQRWLDSRQAAELLRMSRMLLPLGRSPHPGGRLDSNADEGSRFVAWHVRSCLREVGLPNVRVTTQYLRQIVDAVLDEEIGRMQARNGKSACGQIAYHKENIERLRCFEHKLEIWGERCFQLTGLVAVGWLFVYGLETLLSWGDSGHLLSDIIVQGKTRGNADGANNSLAYLLKPLATLFAAALPAIGAAIAGIRAQGDFRSFAMRSEETLRTLKQIETHLADTSIPLTLERVTALFEQAQQAMLSDLSAWRLLYRHRKIGLPS